jgi:predicted XRE-type DNA-binding protein
MSELVAHYSQLRDRVRIGSISIQTEDYPFAAFCIGYLTAATALPIELLFEFMEAINELVRQRELSQPNVKQLLKLLQDFPAEAEKMVKVLKSV